VSIVAPVRVGPLSRVNPVAKLGAVLVISIVLLATIDWVSAAVALVLECGLLVAARLPVRAVLRRTVPLLIAAPLAGATTVLYGQPSGTAYWRWWLIEVSDGSISLGLATVLRILAIGVPAIVLFITIDPTDLADGLAQVVRLPARFVIGALAARRLRQSDVRAAGAVDSARQQTCYLDGGARIRCAHRAVVGAGIAFRRR